jgi:hypothetical protein
MFRIHQTTAVTNYVEHFSTLFDQLKAYEPNPNVYYYTTCFVDDLRADIRITMQHPSTLDTAYALALLQEEVEESSNKSEFHAFDHGASHKPQFRQAIQRQQPQVAAEKQLVKATPQAFDDKLSALRSYRCARGLCDFCAEKWFKDHKCAPTIPLHTMQEIRDLFQLEDLSNP